MSSAASLRLLKFSLIGGIGALIQLGLLAALTAANVNYLLATALAVECSLIHNFWWHQRFTWADRAISGMRDSVASLFRFHSSNGLISLVGSLLLMRIFVGKLKCPVICANIATIAVCFSANFLVSDRWVFFRSSVEHSNRGCGKKIRRPI